MTDKTLKEAMDHIEQALEAVKPTSYTADVSMRVRNRLTPMRAALKEALELAIEARQLQLGGE